MPLEMEHTNVRNSLAPKLSMAPGRKTDNRVTINVGGVRFETYKSTLKNIPDTRLSWLTETSAHNPDYDPTSGEYFFDRHAAVFSMILNYYRTGKLHTPNDVCGPMFEEELAFWGIDEKQIEPCCWMGYSTHREAQETMADFDGGELDQFDEDFDEDDIAQRFGIEEYDLRKEKTFWEKWQPKIWTLVEEPGSSRPAEILAVASVLFVVLSIAEFCMETHVMFREPTDKNITIDDSWSVQRINSDSEPQFFLSILEYICIAFFTMELTVRFSFCPSKLDYIKKPLNWVDLLSITPFYVFIFVSAVNPNIQKSFFIQFLRAMRLIRIFRILKLTRHVSGLKVLVHTVKASAKELLLLILVLFIGVLIFACLIYFVEQVQEHEDNSFKDIPRGFWWAIVTMTTLGYGDMFPRTALGYIVGAMCALCGVLTLALPVPVVVSNFTLYYSHVQARLKLPKKPKRVLVGAADALKTQTAVPGESFDTEGRSSAFGSSSSLKSIDKEGSYDSTAGSFDSGIRSSCSAESNTTGISVIFTDEIAECSPIRRRSSPKIGIKKPPIPRRQSLIPGGMNGEVRRGSGSARKSSKRSQRRQSFMPEMTEVDVD